MDSLRALRLFMRSYATVYARNYDRLCVEVRLFMRGRIAVFHRLFHRDKYILAERGGYCADVYSPGEEHPEIIGRVVRRLVR